MLSTPSAWVLADESAPVSRPVSCEEDLGQAEALLKGCDTALRACATSLGSCNELVEAQKKVLAQQSADIDALQRSQSGILKSPVFWLVAGVAIGAITASALHK